MKYFVFEKCVMQEVTNIMYLRKSLFFKWQLNLYKLSLSIFCHILSYFIFETHFCVPVYQADQRYNPSFFINDILTWNSGVTAQQKITYINQLKKALLIKLTQHMWKQLTKGLFKRQKLKIWQYSHLLKASAMSINNIKKIMNQNTSNGFSIKII